MLMMELMKSAILIFTTFVVGTFATSGGIQEFLVDNGHRHVDIFYNSSVGAGLPLKIYSLQDSTWMILERHTRIHLAYSCLTVQKMILGVT